MPLQVEHIVRLRVPFFPPSAVISMRVREFGTEETQWWMQGIPGKIRMKTSDKYEEDSVQSPVY